MVEFEMLLTIMKSSTGPMMGLLNGEVNVTNGIVLLYTCLSFENDHFL